MQRQSIGSPVSKKLQSHGGPKEEKIDEEEQKRKAGGGGGRGTAVDDSENKAEEKLHRSTTCQTDKSIHLIPILTLFCLLVLYLCSYDPSQKDLAYFNVIARSSKPTDSTERNDFGRFLELDKGGVSAIGSHRILQEVGNHHRKTRFHRKIGNF